MNNKARIGVAGFVISMAGLFSIISEEGFTNTAVIPTKGDVPTIGHGTTRYSDGTPVRMTDTITPERAYIEVKAHVSAEEAKFKRSLPGVKLYQHEYDAFLDFDYQFGFGNWMPSTMRKELLADNHEAACKAMLRYKYAARYDCSTLVNGKPNKRCYGVWTRQLERVNKCLGAS